MSGNSKFFNVNLFLIGLILFTSSFDIFLNFKVFGFSLRFSYIIIFLFLFINSYRLFLGQLYLRFIGIFSFLIWTFFLILFVSNTTLIGRNVGYLLWHGCHFLFILFLANVIENQNQFYRLLRVYIYSFVFVGVVGIIQFFFGIVGVNFFIEQWWFTNVLPRVNGFSYEPSYYATYMLIPWTMMFILLVKNIYLFSRRKSILMFSVISVSILLSTSRMGILFVVLQLLGFLIWILWKSLFKLKIKRGLLYFAFAGLIFFFCTIILFIPLVLNKFSFLLSGTGVAGQSAHSAARFDQMVTLWNIFTAHPFSGTSLGGIPSAIANYNNITITTTEEAKNFEGMNIFLEVLVASGAIGFCFFIYYILGLFQGVNKLRKRLVPLHKVNAEMLTLLSISLFVELLILCFNQNILRAYVWAHIAILNAAYFVFKKQLSIKTFTSEH